LTIAVVSAVAACCPPAPMKHRVNERSDMGFSLELASDGGVLMMGIRDQEMVRVLDLQQLYPFRMAVKSSKARLGLAHLAASVSGYLSRRYIEAQSLTNLFDTQAACPQGS
jgi:hypothetical protein